MFEKIVERINRGILQQFIAFIILWFAIYSAIWTLVEPLGLPIVSKLNLWRPLFIGSTILFTMLIFFSFFFRKKMEQLGLEAGDSNLNTHMTVEGTPQRIIQSDGFHGQILSVSASYSQASMNWAVKASANKAKYLTVIYKPVTDLKFYARVSVLSKNKKSTTQKWLRFETDSSLPQSTSDDEEMGVPVSASDDKGLLRINVDLSKTIVNAFGSHGWRYDKILSIRARGSGKIKRIVLK